MSAVPMLIYCGGETDMAGTTSRVVHHGIGIAGDRRRDDVAEMRAHVDRLIADGGVRDRICRLRQACDAYAATKVAERAVESLLATQQESCVGGAA
jgi:UDP:flavonoid glycosyltransferase YjiC (YdhE family)